MGNSDYRLGVGLMIVNHEGKIFVGKRSYLSQRPNLSSNKVWQMPQGGIKKGEKPEAAVFREMQEEIGTNQGDIIAASVHLLKYDFPKNIQKHIFNGSYKGQAQRWFLIAFTGREEGIVLNQGSQEFIDWKWVTLDELFDLVVEFKRELYGHVIEAFSWYFH